MKKVLFLTTRLPRPTNDGRSKTLDQYISILSQKYEVYLVSFNQNKDINKQDKNIKNIYILEYPPFIKKMTNVITLSILKNEPLQTAAVYSRKMQKKFNRILNEIKPDTIICDMIRTARFVIKSNYRCQTILDMDDVLSKRYLTSSENEKDPLGQLKDSMPSFFVKLISKLHLSKLILKFEYKKIRKKELKLPKLFNYTVLVSPLEVKQLKIDSNCENIYVWPVALNKVYEVVKDYDENLLCFLGNIDASQNQTTLKYILDEIMPNLSNKKLLVVGKCSDETFQLFKKYNTVTFTREVNDVREYVQKCLCLLAPIQYGSGIKIKILESMSYGVPVITSNIGIEGIEVIDEKNILIANTKKEYIAKVNLLLNKEFRENIANESIKYVKENHTYNIAEKIIINTIESL